MDYKNHYRAYKRRLKLLVYEQEYFKKTLEKCEHKLLVMERDKSYLLDQLLRYEQVSPSEDDSSDDLSEDDFLPVTLAPSKHTIPNTSSAGKAAPSKRETSKAPKAPLAGKRNAKGFLNAREGLKKSGTKREALSSRSMQAKREKITAAKAAKAGKSPAKSTKVNAVTVPSNKNNLTDDENDQLVISLPRPGPAVSKSPGPIPIAPPSQFLDTSSSASSGDSSSSDSDDSSDGSDSETDPTNLSTRQTEVTEVIKVNPNSTHAFIEGEHAYGAKVDLSTASPLLTGRELKGVSVVKFAEINSEQPKVTANVTTKPTPQRPSVLVSTIKGQTIGTIKSPLTSPSSSSPGTPSGFYKWSSRPDVPSTQDGRQSVGFTPLVGNAVGNNNKEEMGEDLLKTSLNSLRGSAFHAVNTVNKTNNTN